MPIKLNPNHLGQRSDLEKNNSKYHQSCRISLAIESLKGLANTSDDIHSTLTKVDGALLKTTE